MEEDGSEIRSVVFWCVCMIVERLDCGLGMYYKQVFLSAFTSYEVVFHVF